MFGIYLLCSCYGGQLQLAAAVCDRNAGCRAIHGCGRPAVPVGERTQHKSAKNNKTYAKSGFRTSFTFVLLYFLSKMVNGLDLDRFCIPEHIIQMPKS